MEQLLFTGRVPPEGEALMTITDRTLPQLITSVSDGSSTSVTWLTSETGSPRSSRSITSSMPDDVSTPLVIGIGAFPHGSFSEVVEESFTGRIRLDSDVMMAWHVCAEMVWLYTSKFGVLHRRLEKEL
jgi:rRNA pseudouridine-1189 N-methylase Emg1 (Nep1/Mra1 family)